MLDFKNYFILDDHQQIKDEESFLATSKELPVALVIAGGVLQLPSVEHHAQPEESDHVLAIA